MLFAVLWVIWRVRNRKIVYKKDLNEEVIKSQIKFWCDS